MDFEHGRNWLAEIAVMLFSLASMAQFAISASPRKRRELIDIIRLGEASGIRVAIGEGLLEVDHSFEPTQGYGPADALRLAVSLRALAMVLHFRARLDDQPRETHPLVKADLTLPVWLIAIHALPRAAQDIPLIDTS